MTTQPPAPTLTTHTDASPCPRIEALITPMPADAATVTVWRNYANTTELVRGAVGAPCSGDFLVIDYEAPLGQDVTYTCQTADVSGTLSPLSDPSSVATLSVVDVWASDPLAPTGAMAWPLTRAPGGAVAVKLGSFAGSYDQDATLSNPIGTTLPVAMVGVRRAAAQFPARVVTYSDAADAQLLNLLMQAQVLCLRVPPTVRRIPPVVYVQVSGAQPADDPSLTRALWPLVCTQVQPPGVNVILPVRTYNDVLAEAATYSDLLTLYATYIDLQRGA